VEHAIHEGRGRVKVEDGARRPDAVVAVKAAIDEGGGALPELQAAANGGGPVAGEHAIHERGVAGLQIAPGAVFVQQRAGRALNEVEAAEEGVVGDQGDRPLGAAAADEGAVAVRIALGSGRFVAGEAAVELEIGVVVGVERHRAIGPLGHPTSEHMRRLFLPARSPIAFASWALPRAR
jgi:hypothetical protein